MFDGAATNEIKRYASFAALQRYNFRIALFFLLIQLQRGAKSLDGRRKENGTYVQPGSESLIYFPDSSCSKDGISTKGKKIIPDTNFGNTEHFAPQSCDVLFNGITRFDRSRFGGEFRDVRRW